MLFDEYSSISLTECTYKYEFAEKFINMIKIIYQNDLHLLREIQKLFFN